MNKSLEYTVLAHRYTARYPMLTYLGTQINFWIIANLVLVTVMHFVALVISDTYQVDIAGPFTPMIWIALIFGTTHGLILGVTSYYLDQRIFRRLSIGKIILLKTAVSLLLLWIIMTLLKFVLFDKVISPTLGRPGISLHEQGYRYTFYLLLVYYFFMTLIISFINHVNKKYGPGIVIPLLLGHYRNPIEEERIFMFMDLKSSTATAEALGHLKYSAFIRDCFFDINEILYPYRAQVYQYVGDEIVVTWPESEGLKDQLCIRFYFACINQFKKRADYYLANYGLLPDFKAGLHTGIVTAVEIGEVKRDIAYHGDTLNTAARIQSVCNQYGKSFLISEHAFGKLKHISMKTEQLGMILLKGKASAIGIISVDGLEGFNE